MEVITASVKANARVIRRMSIIKLHIFFTIHSIPFCILPFHYSKNSPLCKSVKFNIAKK